MKKLFVFALFIALAMNLTAQTGERVALIIGNAAYTSSTPLNNPVNDANLMEITLKELGFTVIKRTNATKAQMENGVRSFAEKLATAKVALFYYAGHGIMSNGSNYLIPIDAKLDKESDLKYEALAVNFVVDEFEQYPNNTNIVILDACRDNPLRTWQGSRGGQRGFKAISPTSGTIIAFATSEGSTAADGVGSNGLYTSKLVAEMKKSVPIESVFKNTRVKVEQASNNKQSPQEWSKLKGDFYFVKPNANATISQTSQTNTQPDEGGLETGTVVYEYGTIIINTEIAGTLYVDGKAKGNLLANSQNNKLNKQLTGTHTIEIRGLESFSETVTVEKDQASTINAKSTKKKTTTINNSKDLPDRFTDERDGKSYKLVAIGTQTWMAENLAYKASEGCWAYDNDERNATKYGYLYNFETANKVCPSGWHLPSDEEWNTLEQSVGLSSADAKEISWRGSHANTLKAEGSSGFNVLWGCYRFTDGVFYSVGSLAYFWSSTASGSSSAWYRYFGSTNTDVGRYYGDVQLGFSVRCVRD